MHLGTNNLHVCITPILKFISVLWKLQGSRATHKHCPIEKIFGTDFFFIIGTDFGRVPWHRFRLLFFWATLTDIHQHKIGAYMYRPTHFLTHIELIIMLARLGGSKCSETFTGEFRKGRPYQKQHKDWKSTTLADPDIRLGVRRQLIARHLIADS